MSCIFKNIYIKHHWRYVFLTPSLKWFSKVSCHPQKGAFSHWEVIMKYDSLLTTCLSAPGSTGEFQLWGRWSFGSLVGLWVPWCLQGVPSSYCSLRIKPSIFGLHRGIRQEFHSASRNRDLMTGLKHIKIISLSSRGREVADVGSVAQRCSSLTFHLFRKCALHTYYAAGWGACSAANRQGSLSPWEFISQ